VGYTLLSTYLGVKECCTARIYAYNRVTLGVRTTEQSGGERRTAPPSGLASWFLSLLKIWHESHALEF
jgi:hypothetical protein